MVSIRAEGIFDIASDLQRYPRKLCRLNEGVVIVQQVTEKLEFEGLSFR